MQILDAELPADRFSEAGGEIREEPGEIRLEVGDLLRRERIAMQPVDSETDAVAEMNINAELAADGAVPDGLQQVNAGVPIVLQLPDEVPASASVF